MTLRRAWWIMGFALVGVVIYLCLIPGRQVPHTWFGDKVNHFLAHFAIAAWFAGLVPRRGWWKIVLCLLVLGVGIEVAQGLMHEGREADFRDELANLCGALAALVAARLGLERWPDFAAWLLGRRAA
jgi:glycopeptide antibiotics resistance protein